MNPTKQRTKYFTDSVIRRMTRVCNQYGAVNLSQGFPDNDPPKPFDGQIRESSSHRSTSIMQLPGVLLRPLDASAKRD